MNEEEYLNLQLKRNAIALADHHREHCDGPECDIRLSLVAELLRKAHIEVSQEEWSHFV